MTTLVSWARSAVSRAPVRSIDSIDDYAAALSTFYFNGNAYGIGSPPSTMLYGTQAQEVIPTNLEGYARQAFADSGVVYAVMSTRALVFSGVRFTWQRLKGGKTGDLFGSSDLAVLERPWPGGTTQDLLLRMELDATLAGNSYWTRAGNELVRLRPDWVEIIMAPRNIYGGQVGWNKIGFAYWENGIRRGQDPVFFRADEVAHYAPMPDPLATHRGMSWLTPVLKEITADKAMTKHRELFFRNAAVPQLSVSMDKAITREQFEAFVAKFEDGHKGLRNAYKTLFLGGGADVKVIGTDFKQMDFGEVQGRGEAMIAAAAGVPPVIVGLVKGIEASTYSNYSQARRRFADGTLHPLWMNAAGSLETLVRRPADLPGTSARLWYDASQNPFLLEDRRDAAEIQGRKAATMRQLIDAGFEPATVVAAVEAEDYTLLNHTGLVSVQLLPPGTTADGTSSSGSSDSGSSTSSGSNSGSASE